MKSKWNLVVQDVSTDYAHIWVGSLFPNERKYQMCRVDIFKNDNLIESQTITRAEWDRPFSELKKRFFKLLKFSNLAPGTHYTVKFTREQEQVDEVTLAEKDLSFGTFKTLPTELANANTPFVVTLGSCFYNDADEGRAAKAFMSLVEHPESPVKPDIKVFTGDQVYLDIGLDSLSPFQAEIRDRIADDYAESWQAMRRVYRNGGTWMLADDHEYWNNYPYEESHSPYLYMITKSPKVRSTWKKTATDALKNVQNISPVRSFTIGNDLSFCFADVRIERSKTKFLSEDNFSKLIAWAEGLTCPGVLSLAQPIFVKPGGDQDKNLANYKLQYEQLLTALASTGNDILILSGDVHFGRIASCKFGDKGATIHEVIASPMSNMTGIDAKFSVSTAKKLTSFPAIPINGFSPNPVQYPEEWKVSTEKVKYRWLPLLNHTKTKEHFITLSFSKNNQGKAIASVQAWKVRELDKKGLPKPQFSSANIIELNKVQ